MHIVVTTQDGKTHELEGLSDWRVMEIIRDHGLPIKAECGGCLACGTCHVVVEESWVNRIAPPSDDECDMLDDALGSNRQPNSRLSCQIIMQPELDGLQVTLGKGSEV